MDNPPAAPADMPAGLGRYWGALRRHLVAARAELPPDEREAFDRFQADGGAFLFKKDGDSIVIYLANPRTERMVVYGSVPLAALVDDGTTVN
jgi:hypothetical protein